MTNRLIKKLDGCIKHNFKKVRINSNKASDANKLYDRMRDLKGKSDDESPQAIAFNAVSNYKKVMEEIKTINPEGGKINSQKFWKLKKKYAPSPEILPI